MLASTTRPSRGPGPGPSAIPVRPLVWLFAVAGVLGFVSVLVPRDPVTDDLLVIVVSTLALLTSLVVLAAHGGLGPTSVSAVLVVGVVLASAAIFATGGPPNASSALYTWICLYAAYVLPTRTALLHAAGCALAYGLLVLLQPPPFPPVAHWTTTVGSLIGATALVAVLRRRLDHTVDQLTDIARTDPLTGLANRRHLGAMLEVELQRVARSGSPAALVICDLDHFKRVNDTFGHAVGDRVLRAFADVLRQETRSIDICARIGGEEFAVILPATDGPQAVRVAERLRRASARRLAREGLAVTASFGIACAPEDGVRPDVLFTRADRALYAAKRTGRDRTVRFDVEATDALLGDRHDPPDRLEALLLLAESLDLRDPSTAAHSRTVGEHAARIARRMDMGEGHVERVRLAGVVHDIGKLAVSDAILQKPGPLTAPERRVVERHPELGARLLEGAGLVDMSEWVRAHHERLDGRGYPGGLPGDTIPVEARILAVADAFEAMTADRPYRDAMAVPDALAELRAHAGTQFDPVVVEHLVALETARSPATGG